MTLLHDTEKTLIKPVRNMKIKFYEKVLVNGFFSKLKTMKTLKIPTFSLHWFQKMKVVIVLFALLAVALAAPSPQLPPGISAAECPNYPFCGTSVADQVTDTI